MSSEITQSVAYDNYDDFQHVNFIFSQNLILLFWGLFNDETDLKVRYLAWWVSFLYYWIFIGLCCSLCFSTLVLIFCHLDFLQCNKISWLIHLDDKQSSHIYLCQVTFCCWFLFVLGLNVLYISNCYCF